MTVIAQHHSFPRLFVTTFTSHTSLIKFDQWIKFGYGSEVAVVDWILHIYSMERAHIAVAVTTVLRITQVQDDILSRETTNFAVEPARKTC